MKISGVYSRIFLHFVWSTKNRLPAITNQIENDVKMVFHAKAREMSLEIIASEAAGDHVHVLLRVHQTVSPADIAKHLKGSSSHYVNHISLPTDFDRFYWQDGYGVVSVSPDAVESVARYVRNQKAHHQRGDLIDDLEISSNDVP